MGISDRIKYAEMKARNKKALLPWHKKWWGVLIIILSMLLAIIIIISVFYLFNKIKEINSEKQTGYLKTNAEQYFKLIEGNNDNYFLGAPKTSTSSPIIITNFSNFSCPYSALAAPITEKIAAEFPNDVRFVYRDSPAQDSIILAVGARCAGEQNKFWEMHDMIFEVQEDMIVIEETEKIEALKQMAEVLELDSDKFNSCIEEKRYLDKIKKDYNDGEALGILGTPTWFIEGHEFVGGLSENALRELIMGIKNAK